MSNDRGYVVWDVETGINALFKRKASPWHPDNYVVASGYKFKGDKEPTALYCRRLEKLPSDWFTRLLDGTRLLVGFNIKFDLLYALQEPQNLGAWMEWVAAGGLVWDCQLAEYLLKGADPSAHMLSLDEVSPEYGGDLKIDEVKLLWAAGVDTPDIDKDLLLSYLTGHHDESGVWVDGDIGNTEKVFLGQVNKARSEKMMQAILMNMGALIATVEIERNGMYVDLPHCLKLAEGLATEIEALGAKLQQYIPKDLPFEFNWGSRHHKSALLFGGGVKYVAKAHVLDHDGNPTYYQKKVTGYYFGGELRTSLDDCSFTEEMLEQADRFSTGKRKGEIKTKQVAVEDKERGPKERNEDFLYEFPGFTAPDPKWKNDDGSYSTSEDVINQLAGRGVEFLDDFLRFQGLTKDLGTYYISTNPRTGEKKGMLTLVGDDGIIHHKINQVNTVTTRFSSSEPNLQNVSGEAKSQIKSGFVSRFGGVIVQSDFSSLEVYVQAILSQCKQLIADLKAGLDMHCLRAASAAHKPYQVVWDAVHVAKDPVWIKRRKGAKNFSFQR